MTNRSMPYLDAVNYTMNRAFIEQKPVDTMWRELDWKMVSKLREAERWSNFRKRFAEAKKRNA